MKICEKILCGCYVIALILNFYLFIKNKNIAYIEIFFWIFNTIIMFACARMNEKRADKYTKLYFDLMEKDFEKECEKYKELMKRQ